MTLASVVIATRDRPTQLARCLRALRLQSTDFDFEVIVVDDGSTPSLSMSDVSRFHPRALLVSGKGRGPGAARNLGVERAVGSLLLFTDDDTAPDSEWVQSACHFLARNTDHIGVAGVTISPRFDYLYEHSVEEQRPAFWTCNLAYRREAFEQLGGFAEDLRVCEDLDLGYRAQRLGPIGFSAEMKVTHFPRRLSVPQLIGQARLVRYDVEIVRRHRDRYSCPRGFPRRLIPFVWLAERWTSRLARDKAALARSPRRLGRFLVVAGGQLLVGLITAALARAPAR